MKNTNNKVSKSERAQLRREQALRKKYIRWSIWIVSLAVIVGGIYAATAVYEKNMPGERVEVMKDQGHIDDVTSPHTPYNSDPPTSGPHIGTNLAPWGVHKEPLPKQLLVHNLEDGGVVIYYNAQTDAAVIEKLEGIVNRYTDHVVLTPYPEMENSITLTAWGRIDRLEAFDEKRIVKFIDAYKGIDHHKR
jgi:hypothetical protein